MKEITHYPNGGKCVSCTKLYDNCSHLPFPEMRVIGKDKKTGLLMVMCPEYMVETHPIKLEKQT